MLLESLNIPLSVQSQLASTGFSSDALVFLLHLKLDQGDLKIRGHSWEALIHTEWGKALQIWPIISYTLRTLLACCSQSELRIVKVCESTALFLYNCTLNSLLAHQHSVGCIHTRWIDSFTFQLILFCWLYLKTF